MQGPHKRVGGNLEAERPTKYVSHPLTRSRRESGHLSLSATSSLSTAHLELLSSTRRQRNVHSFLWRFTVQTVLCCCPEKDSACVSILTDAVTLNQDVGQPTLESHPSCHKGVFLTESSHKLKVTGSFRTFPFPGTSCKPVVYRKQTNPTPMRKRQEERAPEAPKAGPRRQVVVIFWINLYLNEYK